MIVETDRLIIDYLRPEDREDYFHSITHDREVQKTFICNYCDTLEAFDFSKYLGRTDILAIRKKIPAG